MRGLTTYNQRKHSRAGRAGKMKLRKRFALRTLLLLLLAVALAFGYAQWRRLSLIQEVRELNAIGAVAFTQPASWRHPGITRNFFPGTFPPYRTIDPAIEITRGFWPQVLTEDAEFNVQVLASGKYLIGKVEMRKEDAKPYLHAIQSRLESLGIKVKVVTVLDIEKGALSGSRPIDTLIPSITVE